jgi:hypothetical protein
MSMALWAAQYYMRVINSKTLRDTFGNSVYFIVDYTFQLLFSVLHEGFLSTAVDHFKAKFSIKTLLHVAV